MSKIETNVIKPMISFKEGGVENLVIDKDSEQSLDSGIKAIEDFMKQEGKGKTDDEKDQLYKEAKELHTSFVATLTDVKYNFHLNRSQWRFLTDLLLKKMDYDVNTVFFAIELSNLLGKIHKEVKFTGEEDLVAIPVNATEITYIYHLIAKHTVKGLTRDSYSFAQVLTRIGVISKILNYYDAAAKNSSDEIMDWVAAFDENVTVEVKAEELVD